MIVRNRTRDALALGLAAGTLLAASGTAQAAESSLVYMTWAGYDDPAFRTAYTEEYGEGPEFVFYSHTDEGYAQLVAGFRADVAHPCIHDVKKWKDSGLLKPIDPAKVQAWDDLIAGLRDADALVLDGQHWLVPWEWGSSSVIYRTDKVELPEETYRVLTDPAYKGKTSVPDAFDEIYQVSALLAGVKEPLALEEAEYAAVEKQMRAIHDNVRMIWGDPTQLEQALASGEIEVAWGWPNSYSNLTKEGVPVDYMLQPEEGLVTWTCGLAVLENGDAPEEEVYDFINALTSPETGKKLVENFGYGHANTEGLALVDPKQLESFGMAGDPAKFIAEGNLMGPMPEEQRQRLIQTWETIKAGG